MDLSIEEIWFELSDVQDPVDPLDCNSDVIFQLSDGSKWAATFFTYRNIETLRKKNQLTGECLNGRYFCAADMILISEMSKEIILSVLQEMLRQGEIRACCRELS